MQMLRRRAKVAPHLPADPEKKNAAGEQEPDYFQKLRRYAGAYDAKGGRSENADCDCAFLLLGGQVSGGKPDDESIVSSQHQVDGDDLNQGRDSGAADEIGHDASVRAGSISQPIRSTTFDPIKCSTPERSQWRHVLGEQHQTDWKHPQSGDRQKPQHAASCEQ
jgi:hypothetical protein